MIKEESNMPDSGRHIRGYALAAVVGAIVGGTLVAIGTKAVPKMMSSMMQTMMMQMEESGCDPAAM
jgi:hypothetical protein